MDFEPPRRETANVVIGVDPPAAWCLWGQAGVLAASQEKDLYLAASRCRDARISVGIPEFKKAYASSVERPFGSVSGNLQTLIVEALCAGWWSRELRHVSLAHWHPLPGQWRKRIGIKGMRKRCKEQAVALAKIICDLQGIPYYLTKRGKPAIDVSEAICIAFSTWLAYGLMVDGDMSHRLCQKLGLPYDGKQMYMESEWRYFELPFSVKVSPTANDKVMVRIKDIVQGVQDDPWGEPGPETEGAAQGRLGDQSDDDGEDWAEGDSPDGEDQQG